MAAIDGNRALLADGAVLHIIEAAALPAALPTALPTVTPVADASAPVLTSRASPEMLRRAIICIKGGVVVGDEVLHIECHRGGLGDLSQKCRRATFKYPPEQSGQGPKCKFVLAAVVVVAASEAGHALELWE